MSDLSIDNPGNAPQKSAVDCQNTSGINTCITVTWADSLDSAKILLYFAVSLLQKICVSPVVYNALLSCL